ncbi:substrate-binding domain-containing protein [Muricoccus radiodurans]|uniref:substrate-binding domain-containing protein n=1 Tax=Muricoccus radiodurans TaxID=2231721 RepID=UPI003CF37B46
MIARRPLLAASLAPLAAQAADPVRILSGGALEPAVHAALGLWTAAGGTPPNVAYATAPRIAERMAAGDQPDLVLAPVSTVAALNRSGKLVAAPVALGSVGVGIAVRDGAPVPRIADEAALRAELQAADAVIFNRASTGLYMEGLLARLGLDVALAPKTIRFPDGDGVLRRLASGTGREIAFAAATEIALFRQRGVRLVGPLPEPLQNRTAYAAGLFPGDNPDAARLLAFLDSPEARAAMRDAGVE